MLDRLKPKPGSKRRRKRLGRGPGSGRGKTATHGVKGQGKRGTGHPVRQGFEGGQMPLNMRLPKKGFTNLFRKDVEIVNLASLSAFGDGATIDLEGLAARGLIRASRPSSIAFPSNPFMLQRVWAVGPRSIGNLPEE